MTQARERHTDNIVVGAGEVHLDLFDAAGAKTGERYLGDCAGATLAVTTEETRIFSGTGAVATELVTIARQVTREIRLTLHDMSLENMALFVIGDTVKPAAVANEAFAVEPDKSYQLGVSPDNPAGYSRLRGDVFNVKKLYDSTLGAWVGAPYLTVAQSVAMADSITDYDALLLAFSQGRSRNDPADSLFVSVAKFGTTQATGVGVGTASDARLTYWRSSTGRTLHMNGSSGYRHYLFAVYGLKDPAA